MQADLHVFSKAERVALYELVRTGQLMLKGEESVQFASLLHAEYFLSKDRSPTRSLEVHSYHFQATHVQTVLYLLCA